MFTRRFACVLVALAAVAAVAPGATVTHAARHTAAVPRLPSNPKSPAFRFGLTGGFTTAGTFTITLYVDGRVTLARPRNSPIHLINPRARVYPIALRGLLTLARAEGFFAMPASIVPRQSVSDAGTASISIYTTSGVKMVRVAGNSSAPFYELYSLLYYVAGATS